MFITVFFLSSAMIRWIPYTFVRTVLFFIGGILLGLYSPDLIAGSTSFYFAAVLTVLYFLIVFMGRKIRHSVNPGWVGLLLVFVLGFIHVVYQTESRDPAHLLNTSHNVSHYQAVITRFAEDKAQSWKMEARIFRAHTDRWTEKKGTVILYLSKRDFTDPFRYGDVLLINGQPDRPSGPANPGEFDYKTFLARKNIYHQHFLRAGQVLKTDYAPPNRFMAFAFRGREWAEATLKTFVDGPQQQAIASALVLGVTDGLDNELLDAYAATGSMHILAVSGLHVSILYFILLWMLKPLNRLPGGRWFVAFTALLLLWLYAFVTGLSPSVLRAVTMFSFLAIARPWARNTNIYNTLAVSAFCLLLFDPFLICSVGFQLSYLAVLGIVYLYPKILVLWEPQQWITTEIWRISAVSIAAQVATFPLGLLYFHQFPNYFLLSNLLVVPLSSVVLIMGLTVLCLSFIPTLATLAGFCLEMIIRFLNAIVFTLETFPFSVTGNIYVSPLQCGLIILFILALLALMQYRRFKILYLCLLIATAYAGTQWWRFSREVDVTKMTVYRVPGHSVIDFIDRGKTFFLADSGLRRDQRKIRYHVAPNRLIAGANKIREGILPLWSSEDYRLIVWNGKKILLITSPDFQISAPVDVDWIIIANNAVRDVTCFAERITCQTVILDSSNSFFFASRFLEAAKLHKLDAHSVLHQGAFVAKIKKRDSWNI